MGVTEHRLQETARANFSITSLIAGLSHGPYHSRTHALTPTYTP